MKTGIMALAAALTFAACSAEAPTTPQNPVPLAKSSRPLKSSWSGTNSRGTGCAPAPYTAYSYLVTGNYTGNTSHFGNGSATMWACMVATSATGGVLSGPFEIVAANGDKVVGNGTGGWRLVSASPFAAEIWGTYTITGGTGRFENASGSGDLTGGQTGGWSNEENSAWMEFDGTIEY